MTITLKFGGTSVGSAAAMRQAADVVADALPRAPLVVLSAMSGTTDALFAMARTAERGDGSGARAELEQLVARHLATCDELFDGRANAAALVAELEAHRQELDVLLQGVSLLRELSPRSRDAIVGHGELLSTAIFAHLLRARGHDCQLADARAVVRTDDTFGQARPQRDEIAALCAERLELQPGRAIVTQGYIGGTAQGLTTTLGRGGSDYSATLLGAATRAEEVQIWTDVEGVLTGDPRVVDHAQPIASLTFAEAAELAAFGAKVLHPATIQPAVEADIPVTVRRTSKPAGRFTTITRKRAADRTEQAQSRPVTALASRGPITVLTLSSAHMFHQAGYLGRVFEVFGRLGVSVDLVATAEVSVSCTVEHDAPVAALQRELAPFARVDVARDRTLIAVIGSRLKYAPFAARDVLTALGDIPPELISLGGNEINLSVVVPQERATAAVRRLHAAFFPPPAASAARHPEAAPAPGEESAP